MDSDLMADMESVGSPSKCCFGEDAAPTDVAFRDADGGDTFTIGVSEQGHVIGWGSAFYGELGASASASGEDSAANSERELVEPERLVVPEPCALVACGGNHVLVLSRAGRVFAWGWNKFGQVGSSEATIVTSPTVVEFQGGPEIRSLAGGGMHSLAVDDKGRAWSWGHNKYGQLGRAVPETYESDPVLACVQLREDIAVSQAAAGWAHSALVATSGEVLTFGWGLYHQLGHSTTHDERIPATVDALLGLDPSNRVVQVACGTWHTAARTATGDLYTWGWGPDGQLGHFDSQSQVFPRVVDVPAANHDSNGDSQELVDVVCGARFTVGLCRRGDVVQCGLGSSIPPLDASASASSANPTAGAAGAATVHITRYTPHRCVRKLVAGSGHALALVASQ